MPRFRDFRPVLLLAFVCVFVSPARGAVPSTRPATATAPSITFLDATAARKAIVDDSMDPYFERLQPMEMGAKTGALIMGNSLAEQRTECRRRYQAEIRDFSEDEKAALRRCVEGLYEILHERYPLFAQMPWSFLKTSTRIESGWPHTRGRHIVLSEGVCRQVNMLGGMFPKRMLLEEQMHVFQRTHPGFFDSLYTKLWGFEHAKVMDLDPYTESHHLINPDGADCRWVFPLHESANTTYLLPYLLLQGDDGLRRMGRDMRMVALELEKTPEGFRTRLGPNNQPILRSLSDVSEYCRVFAPSHNIYHPNEAAADLFVRLALRDTLLPKTWPATQPPAPESLQSLRQWFDEHLGPGRCSE